MLRRCIIPVRGTALAAVFLACAGCTAISPKSRMGEIDMNVPGTWAASKEGSSGVDSAWVVRFKDRRLNELVDEALRNNRDLKAAAARVERARGRAREAGAAGNPYSDLTFQGVRSKRNFIGFPLGGPGAGADAGPSSSLSNVFDLTLDIRWEADVWGRIAAGKSAAQAQFEAAVQDERAARASLAANVARAWFALLEAESQVRLAKEAQQVFEQTAQAVRERFKAGEEQGGAAANLRLAETDVASARAAMADRQQQAETAKRQLEVLVGRYPAGAVGSSVELPAVPPSPPVGLPSELLQRRPDVLAAERRFASAGKSLTEAKRALFPRLSLTANSGTSSGDLSELLNSDFGVWQLAGNVVQPVLAGGQLRAQADIRRADEREALATLQQSVLQAFAEVETALVSDRMLAQRERALADAARLAGEADTAARADYKDGIGDMLTVLTAQSRRITARSQLITVHRLRLDNRVNLHLALGGDYQPRSESP